MKLKNLAGAFVVLAGLAFGNVAVGGNIYEIRPVDEDGNAIMAPTEPIGAGSTVYFVVRLAAPAVDGKAGKPFRLVHNPLAFNTEATDWATGNRPGIGIYVNGKLVIARLVKTPTITHDSKLMTDYVFSYTVKAGDFALPIRLANSDGTVVTSESEDVRYYFDRCMAVDVNGDYSPTWFVEDSTAAGGAKTTDADFQYIPSSGPGYPGLSPVEPDGRSTDYDLSGCNFNVRTVDFDSPETPYTEGFWRTVPDGDIGCWDTTAPRLVLTGMPTNSVKLYLWSDDDTAAYLADGKPQTINVTATETKTCRVLEIDTVKDYRYDIGGYEIRLAGATGAKGKTANIVLSGFTNFNYRTGSLEKLRVPDYLSKPVIVGEKMPARVTVKPAATTVTATSDYTKPVTELQVSFNRAFTEDVVVEIIPGFKEGTYAGKWQDYLRFGAVNGQDLTYETPATNMFVCIPAGSTVPSKFVNADGTDGDAITGGRIYVYALRSDDHTRLPNGGITFKVDTTNAAARAGAAAGGYDGWDTVQGGFTLDGENPVITSMFDGTDAASAVADAPRSLQIAISDLYADIHCDPEAGEGYQIWIVKDYDADDPSKTKFEQVEGLFQPGKGGVLFLTNSTDVLPTVKYSGAKDLYNSRVYVVSPVSGNLSADHLFTMTVKTPDKIVVEYDDNDHDEGDEIQLKLHLENSDGQVIKNTQGDMWVFIKGQGDEDQAAIYAKKGIAKAGTKGIKFGNYETSLSEQFKVEVLDGDESKGGLNFMYDVVFLDCEKWPETEAEVTAHTVSYYKNNTPIVFTVRNVIPSVDFISINDGVYEVYESGSALKAKFPAGVTNTLSAIVIEPGELDRTTEKEDELFTVRWRFTDEAGGVDTIFVKGDPDKEENVCKYDFPMPGTYRVQVDLKDKDMGKKYGNGEYNKTFDFTVEVSDNPSIKVTGFGAGEVEKTVFEETEAPDADVLPWIELNLDFNNFTKEIVAKLEVTPGGADNPGRFVLSTNNQFVTTDAADPNVYYVRFARGVTKRQIEIVELDGTQTSRGQGFTLTPSMVSTDLDPKSKRPANEYYVGVPKVLKVSNVAPVIEELFPEPGTNVYEVALGAADPITWSFTDVLPDFTDNGDAGITVTVKGGGGFTTNVTSRSAASGSFTPVFTSSGEQKVQLTILDKDNGRVSFIWTYNVAIAKTMTIRPHGPTGGFATANSKRYRTASGLGEGRVWAKGLADIVSFESTYNCAKETDWTVYGYGYKVGDIDDGVHLWKYADRDIPVNGLGNPKGAEEDGYAYNSAANPERPQLKDKYGNLVDSFLYTWLQISRSDDASGALTDAFLGEAFSPEYPLTTDVGVPVALPNETKDDKKEGYDDTKLEAIFSREYLATDNMGDINQDGVPDIYVDRYGMGVVDTTTGKLAEEGKDLNSLAGYNADMPSEGGEDAGTGDYLPGDATVYAGLPIAGGKSTWTKKFTADLEIRGFGEGLNDAPIQLGITGVRPDRVYEDPDLSPTSTLSKVEFLAWSEFKAANPSATVEDWSPERPTDPTKTDTDEDGFEDGFEYYYWYLAHVGYIDANGVHRHLTGRRYDPRNPGEGTFIASEEIARAFDPRVKYTGSDADTLDTDNDGLPDLLEFEIGTNPFDFDTDGDGLPDGWEIMISGTDPLKAYTTPGICDAMRNYDGDAMAFTTAKLESGVLPKPFDIVAPTVFALVQADGMSDGVQWYADEEGTAEPAIAADEASVKSCTAFTVSLDGKTGTFVTVKAVPEGASLFAKDAAGKLTLAVDLTKDDTWEAIDLADEKARKPVDDLAIEIPEGVDYIRLMPVRLGVGTPVSKVVSEIEVPGDPEADPPTEDTVRPATCAALVLTEAVAGTHAAWTYGSVKVPTLTTGETSANKGGFGMLALGKYLDAPAKKPLAALPKDDENLAYLHYLVYQKYGFDPRTAWNAKTPLNARWGKTAGSGADKEAMADKVNAKTGYAGQATRTREYTAYDEFLVFSFFLNNGMTTLMYEELGPTAPGMAELWYANTTNPQGPNEPDIDTDGKDAADEAAKYWGRNSDSGADTDLDGVPDGWELYVMSGPKQKGKFVFPAPYDDAPYSNFSPFVPSAKSASATDNKDLSDGAAGDGDNLTEFQEFEGTDTMAYYRSVAPANPTIVHESETPWTWFNKFFPTDPWGEDTDQDGLKDGDEIRNVNGFNAANFLYADVDTGKACVPGGGLNPCSVDTDQDGLPDGWEAQFAGAKTSVYTGADCQYAAGTDAEGNEKTSQVQTLQGLSDGMDGTVKDAYNYVRVNRTTSGGETTAAQSELVSVDGVNQVVDRDYDHDGLENWQEYLVGTMRCWRYDDPVSPWTSIPTEYYYDEYGVFDPFREDGKYLRLLGIDTSAEDEGRGEFWYRTLFDKTSKAYNPHLVTGSGSASLYFSRVTNGFDPNFVDTGSYYVFYDRINADKLMDLWDPYYGGLAPVKYISCSPKKADTDGDGMDDYYELFHGLNPILGADAELSYAGGCDIVFDAWYVDPAGSPISALDNIWINNAEALLGRKPRTNDPKNNKFDFELFPWLNGLEGADADGDDLRNQDEAIMPMMAPQSTWHHTDPSALWFTDTSYTNSLVSRFYRLPATYTDIGLPGATFKFGEDTYSFSDADGYWVDILGGKHLAPFTADHWLLTSGSSQNWMYSFEENEGYDTDHDGISDREELLGRPTGTVSDPQEADSPHNRQAMYFAGEANPSALQSMPFLGEAHPRYGWSYPDDMSFLQYTVECWVRPEEVDAAKGYTVLERAIWSSYSAAGDEELLRKNFQIAIRKGCWYTKFDANGTLEDSTVELQSTVEAKPNEWAHVAATYDGAILRLYVNGVEALKNGVSGHGLKPEYGASAVIVHPGEDATRTNGLYLGRADRYWWDREYPLHAFIIGASAKNQKDLGGPTKLSNSHLNVTNGRGWNSYTNFFRGYIDEVRVWDGARASDKIKADMMKRYTAADAKANRDDFYDQWSQGRYRYDKDGNGRDQDVIPELRYHWSFDSLPGAENAEMAAKSAHGYGYVDSTGATQAGAKAPLARPVGYEISWWCDVLFGQYGNPGYGSVYGNPAYVTWVPNTVTHLPRFDGTTLDSFYWAQDTEGIVKGSYPFAQTAEPVSRWVQYQRQGPFTATTDGTYVDFRTTPRRFWQANVSSGSNTVDNTSILFEFTGRHLNQMGDDLLPLGGAFVKYVDAMWDEQGPSTASRITGTDDDNNGLPNWWDDPENGYAVTQGYVAKGTVVTWNTPVDYHGRTMTAGEAYLLDLAKGIYVDKDGNVVTGDTTYQDKADEDHDGMPDWWELLTGIHNGDTKPTPPGHADDDPDNDGLENYQEFLVAYGESPYGFYTNLMPNTSRSLLQDQAADDYFLPVPQSSLATIRKLMMARASVPNAKVPDEPISKGEYLGAVFSDHDFMENRVERTLLKGQSSPNVYDPYDDVDADGWDNWSEVRAYQNAGTVKKFDHIEEKFFTQVLTGTTTANAQKRVALENQYGAENVQSINWESRWDNVSGTWIESETVKIRQVTEIYNIVPAYGGTPVPTVNVRVVYRGAKIRNVLAGYAEMAPATDSDGLVRASLKDSEDNPINIHFAFHTTSLETPDALYVQTPSRKEVLDGQMVFALKETSRIKEVTKTVGEYGFVRQGHNKLIVFADTSDDGAWQPGEPYGVVRDVQIGWDKVTEVVVELTDESAVVKRMPLVAAQEGAGGGAGEGEETASVAGLALVRVIRESINGQTVADSGERIRERVLLQKMLPLAAGLTEIDVLTAKKPDLDWLTLTKDATKYGFDNVKSVKYRVETVTEDGTNVVGTFTKEFAEERPQAVAVSPVQDAPVYSSAPTFRFDVDEGATAFGIQVAKEDGTVVYDSGARTLCGLGTDTVGNRSYTFTAPIYAGEPIKSVAGPVLESGKRYMWRVAAFNAKFDAAANADYSTWMNFQVDVDNVRRYPGQETGYGRVDVAVRYYGPQRLAAGFSQKSIIVEAFDNAGFTGAALAQTRVEAGNVDLDSLFDVVTANSQLKGVAPGDVYVRAYIDLNDDGAWQKHEPWGYVNKVGSGAPDLYTPVPAAVVPSTFMNPVRVTVFIEDTDVNKNEYPDCLEQACFPDTAGEDDDEDAFDWWTWANADEDDPGFAADGDVMAYAEVDRYLVAIGPESETDRTKWGYYLLSADETKVPDLSDRGNLAAGNYRLDTCYVYGNGRIWSAPLYGLGVPVTISDPTLLVKDVKPVKVALVHNQVYQAFPYDMRTANPEAFEPDANGIDAANRTKAFTAIDRKLLPRYFEAIGYAPSLDPDKSLDQCIDELFKQGKVAQATALCDAYSLKVGDADQNRDGIADGWQLYVMFNGNQVAASTPWTSAAAARTVTPGKEGLTWVQEYEGGHYPTDPWQVSTCKDTYTIDGVEYVISDKDAYAYHLKHFAGEEGDKYADFDNDGLCNYDEFDIMKNNNRTLSADEMFSYFGSVTIPSLTGQCVPDYFLKSTKRNPKITDAAVYDYLGFDYTSHDFIESWWKDQYGLSRTEFAPYADTDADGWDDWSERQAGTNPKLVAALSLDGEQLTEHPLPVLAVTTTFDGTMAPGGSLVIEAYANGSASRVPDARWTVGGKTESQEGEDAAEEGKDAEGDAGSASSRFIGMNPNKPRNYSFGPGKVVPASFKIMIKDPNFDHVNWQYKNGTLVYSVGWAHSADDASWVELCNDRVRLDDPTMGDIIRDGKVVGWINYETGAAYVDFTKLQENKGFGSSSDTTDEQGNVVTTGYSETHHTAQSYVKLTWRGKMLALGGRMSFSLSEPEAASEKSGGLLRQGLNTIVAYLDANGNGEYDPGEPFGCVKDVDVGFDKVADLNINLAKTSPVLPRFDPAAVGEGVSSNGAVTVEYKGKPVISDLGEYQTVRIVRWEINGQECAHRTVLSKTAEALGVITEADVLSTYSFDLDWNNLETDAAKIGCKLDNIRTVTYAVFVDGGTLSKVVEENVTGWIVKSFSGIRDIATPVSPAKGETAIVTATRPTFEFRAPEGYPAFAFELCDKDGNVVFESTEHVGAKNAAGNVTYRPPVYFGWDEEADTTNRLLPNGEYTWRVALLNAKYRHAGDWSDEAKFTVELAKGKVHDTDKGMLDVVVRYYGNAVVDAEHPIIVQAFRTADFTGIPEGQTAITNADLLASYDNTNAVNAKIYGLAAGDYYICAFIDTTNDVKRMRWESWGYVNNVGTDKADLYTPVATKVMRNDTSTALLFIEDMDCNNDEIPDWMDPEDIEWVWPWPEPDEPIPVPEPEPDPDDPDDPHGDVPSWFPHVDPVAGDVMAYRDIEDVLLVTIGGVEYAVMDLEGEGMKLRDSDIALQTMAKDLRSLVSIWSMGRYVGIGTNVTFTGDEKVTATRLADIRLVHAQVYADQGFNTLTANGQAYLAGTSVDTKPFTYADKYFFCRYLENIGVEGVSEAKMLAEVKKALKGVALTDWETVARSVWRKYTLDPDEIDMDRDDVADGWEAYVMFGTTGLKAFTGGKGIGTLAEAKISPFNVADGMLVAPGEGSQLKLVEEFDGGYLPTDPWNIDTDGDSVIDWYAYQYHLKGDDAGKDRDGDGLSNYAEYLITEVFQYAECDPDRYATNDGICDYFKKVGDLYLGEIFTDHDQVGDEWEDAYQAAANRYVYDPERDDDNDGWSNYAEFRAGTNPSREISLGADEYTFGEFPIPVVEATVVYNGSHPLKKAIVFKAWNEAKDADMLGAPDAVWSLGTSSSNDKEGTGAPSDSGSTLIEYTKYCGRNTGDLRVFNLTGGAIAEGSVRVCFRDSSYIRTAVGSNATLAADANWYAGVTDEDGKLVDMRGKGDVGTVDYATGMVTLDLSKFSGRATGLPNSTSAYSSILIADKETAGNTGGSYYDDISLDNSTILLKWDAMKIGTRADGTYYLADADAISDAQPSLGHLKEGKAVFVCFSDEDGNGKYTVGEPYGFVRGVDVGWQGAKFTVELTEASPVFARVDLYGASDAGSGSSGGEGEAVTAVMTDRMFYWGTDSGDIPAASYTNLPNEVDAVYGAAQNEYEHVRIVPYLVAGVMVDTAYYDREYAVCYQYVPNRVVAEFDINRTTRPCITEADFIRDGKFDIDWDGFDNGIALSPVGNAVGDVTAVKYRIVFGKSGPIGRESNLADETEKVRAFSTLIERRYEPWDKRTKPTQLRTDGVVHGAQPTFKWRLDENTEILGYSPSSALFGCSYTAFQIEVYNRDTNEKVYDSGLVRAPAKDANGFFTWTAPLYAGDQTDLKAIFAKAGNWKWRVVMNNAKFLPKYNDDEDAPGWSEYAEFSTSVDTQQEINDHSYSAIDVAVKYAGPVEVLKDCADLSKTEGKVRIQAFATADFSGEPVAQGFVTNRVSISNTVDVTANGRLIGLPEGTYYIRAYIDSNGNFTKDDFESWGGAKDPVTVPDASRLAGAVTPVPAIWIEDADTDQDWLPDAWEYAKYGTLAKEGAKIDPEGRIVLKKTVYDGLLAATTKANFSKNRSGASLTFFENIGNATLLLGLKDVDVTQAGIADIRAAVEKKIEEGSVKITSLVVDATSGKVILTVGARTTDSIAGYMFSPVYEIPTSTDVTIKIYKKENLATDDWKLEKTVKTTIESTMSEKVEVETGVNFNSGFFKVEVVK